MRLLRLLSQLNLVGRIFLAILVIFLVSYSILLLVYLDKSVTLQRESVAEEMEATLGMLERGIAEQAVWGTTPRSPISWTTGQGKAASRPFSSSTGQARIASPRSCQP